VTASVGGEYVPRIPFDSLVPGNSVLCRLYGRNCPHVRAASEQDVGIEVGAVQSLLDGRRATVCPNGDEIVPEDALQLVR
jgi:hypothetical protein